MVKAIRIRKPGGPETMEWTEVTLDKPGPGEARIRLHAAGLNFLDVYHRTGLYPLPLPSGIGMEGAGVVEEIGAGVLEVKVGDRVAFASGAPGSYAEARVMPARSLVKLPRSIDFETAAGMMLKGLTVQYLFRRTYKLQRGQTILFHAAAGGVGLIAMQWAKALGVTVIGTAGSEEKAELAREHGCDHVILYKQENIVDRVRELTGGRMVPVVYDGVGKDTFNASLECLQPFGLMVSFGNSSGPVPPVALTALKGTLYLTRPSLMPHVANRSNLEEMADDLFRQVTSGKVKIRIDQRYAMADAAKAHRDLESRKTTGQTVLLP
ncbi:MAG TPA: quinone oxidoreductase [Lautropia sp.]|jgi:NADPH2:quinone reductase|nr:quinone oxidoreductase [Lautropia sp.]